MPNGSTFRDKVMNGDIRTPVSLTVGKSEIREAAVPLSFFDPSGSGSGDEAQRCMDCGIIGCQDGATDTEAAVEIVGCPFERNIPEIHTRLKEANGLLETAHLRLKAYDSALAQQLIDEIQPEFENPELDLPEQRAKLPQKLFAALREHNPRIAGDLQRAHDKHLKEAFEMSYNAGPMGDIYGRICPDSLCVSGCSVGLSGFNPLAIPMNEASLWDYAWESNWLTKIEPEKKHDETFVVFGSGFAAFAFAERMLEQGFNVVMVEKNDELGEPGNGQILNYKVQQQRFNRHYQRLIDSGMKVMKNTEVGMDAEAGQVSPQDLVGRINDEFNLEVKGIAFATGTPVPGDHRVRGEAAGEITHWREQTLAQADSDRTGAPIPEKYNAGGKSVAIIATGDTAVDSGRTASIQIIINQALQQITKGAGKIRLIARRDQIKAKDMNALKKLYTVADEYGVDLDFQFHMESTELRHAEDPSKGRFELIGNNTDPDNPEQTTTLHADMVINALSNKPLAPEAFGLGHLPKDEYGNFAFEPVAENEKYNIGTKAGKMGHGAGFLGDIFEGVQGYIIGDAARGEPSLAAKSGRDGVDMARAIALEEYGLIPAA